MTYAWIYLRRPEGGTDSLEIESQKVVSWELNMDPIKEQGELSTTESALQPL